MEEEFQAASDLAKIETLSARQQQLIDELTELNRELGGLYRQGLLLLPTIANPGVSHLLAHIGRELTLGVVDLTLNQGSGFSPQEMLAVPNDEKHRSKIALSLGLSVSDSRVTTWFELHKYFVGGTHLRRGKGVPPDSDELLQHFSLLEQLLFGRIGPYFQTQAELDEFIAMDSPDENSYSRLQPILLRPQQRRYFFKKLPNAIWAELLEQKGVFDRPPGRRVFPNGSWQIVPWPEGEYLARIAGEVPKLVVRILRGLPQDNDNPAVVRVVIDVTKNLPPKDAVALVPIIQRALAPDGPWTYTREILELIPIISTVSLDAAFGLASAVMFVPYSDELAASNSHSVRNEWAFPRLQYTQFADFATTSLSFLEAQDQFRTLKFLLEKLSRVALLARRLEIYHGFDSALRQRGPTDPNDSVRQLVIATRDVLTRFVQADPSNTVKVQELIDGGEDELAEWLQYQLIAVAGKSLQNELDDLISSPDALEPKRKRREVALVLREQFKNASATAKKVFVKALEAGPGSEKIKSILSFHGVDSPSSKEIDNIVSGWQRERLIWFRGKLPPELKELAQRLDIWDETPSVRDQELAEVGFHVGTGEDWERVESEGSDDFNDLSSAELSDHLRTLVPSKDYLEAGRSNSLDLKLEIMAKEDTVKALEVWESIGRLPHVAVGLLNGLRHAIGGKVQGNFWPFAMEMTSVLVSQVQWADEKSGSVAHDHIRSIVDFFDSAATKDQIPAEYEEEGWRILGSLVRLPSVWADEGDIASTLGSVFSDSLNKTAPRAMRALLSFALWSYRRAQDQEQAVAQKQNDRIAERLTSILDEIIGLGGDLRTDVNVVLGQRIPQLHLLAPEWLTEHLPVWLSGGATNPLGHPAWGAYLCLSSYHDDVFTLLRPWYQSASVAAGTVLGRANSSDDDWSISKRLSEHVLTAVVRGKAAVGDDDKLVEQTFTAVSASDLSESYHSMYRRLSRPTDPLSPDLLKRLTAFWEWRIGELETSGDCEETREEAQGLSWFIQVPGIPDEDALSLGVRTTRLALGDLGFSFGWERLSTLAETNVDVAYEICELVLRAEISKQYFYIRVEDVKPLLEAALKDGKPETRAGAQRLIHRLGEAGYDELANLLNSG